MQRADRLRRLPPYPFARWAREISDVQRAGQDVIRLDIGNPDLPPPEAVIQALCDSAQNPARHGYSGYRGLPALRQAIADYYGRRFGVVVDPDTQVLPLIGSKEGIVNMALAYLDSGGLALIPDPGYAPYAMGTMLAGAEVYRMPLVPERGFLPDLHAVPAEVADRAALMWLNYPNNPTGAVAPLSFLEEVVAFAKQHATLICFDAPYCDVTYDDYRSPSILQVPGAADVAVEFNSLSKTYNMAGWRVGMAVGHTDAIAALAQVKSNVDSGLFHPVQEAAIQALRTPDMWLTARNALYQERIKLLAEGLSSVGLHAEVPKAALYLWVRIPDGWDDSESFSRALLQHAGIAVAPGSFFGESGEGYIRISATVSTENIHQAVARMVQIRDLL